MYVHNKIEHSHVNGPGDRAVIWLQGCTLGCPGCWNQETHQHGNKSDSSFIDAWVSRIVGIDGVTFSGGEPMQQAPDLLAALRNIKRLRPELTLGMFSGYTLRELENAAFSWYYQPTHASARFISGSVALWRGIKSYLDFAVLGRYNQQLNTRSLPMRSSCNQELVLFSGAYRESDFDTPSCEITISPTGDLVHITGFPENHTALREAF